MTARGDAPSLGFSAFSSLRTRGEDGGVVSSTALWVLQDRPCGLFACGRIGCGPSGSRAARTSLG